MSTFGGHYTLSCVACLSSHFANAKSLTPFKIIKSCNPFNHACLTPELVSWVQTKNRRSIWASLQTFFGNKDFCPLQTHFPQIFGCCSATPLQTINCERQQTSAPCSSPLQNHNLKFNIQHSTFPTCFTRLQFQNSPFSIFNSQLRPLASLTLQLVDNKKMRAKNRFHFSLVILIIIDDKSGCKNL